MPNEEDFEEFMGLWGKAQLGEGSWEDVEFYIPRLNDLSNNEFSPKKETVWPMCDITPREGVKAIQKFNIVYVDVDEVENIETVGRLYKHGFGLNYTNKELFAYIAHTENDPRNITTSWFVLFNFSLLPGYMSKGTASSYVDKSVMKILSTEIISYAYKSSIKVFGMNGERHPDELQYNP